MPRGLYTVTKHKAEFVDGEWRPIEELETFEIENDVSYAVFQKIIVDNPVVVLSRNSTTGETSISSGVRIVLTSRKYQGKTASSFNVNSFSNDTTSDTIDGIFGDVITGIPQVEFIDPGGSNPAFWQWQNRWDPPTTNTRIINTFLIAPDGNVNTNELFSVAPLTTPCTQTTSEILTARYQLFLDTDEAAQYAPDLEYTTDELLQQALDRSIGGIGASFPEGLIERPQLAPGRNFNNGFGSGAGRSGQSQLEGYIQFNRNFDLNDSVGSFFSGVQLTSNIASPPAPFTANRVTHQIDLRRPTDTVVQNTFLRAQSVTQPPFASVRPFLDAANVGTSLGSAIVSDTITTDTSWTGPGLPSLYKIEITTGGAVGTAEYKFSRRSYVGFAGSGGFQGNDVDIPWLPDEINRKPEDIIERVHGCQAREFERARTVTVPGRKAVIQRYAFPEFVSWDTDGINVLNINAKADQLTIDTLSTPALPCTDIRQVRTFEDGTILVACAATGLWRIDRTPLSSSWTVTQITPAGVQNATACYGICTNTRYSDLRINNGERWYAIFGQEFCYSDDQGANWTVLNNSTANQFLITGFADTDGVTANGANEANMNGLIFDYWAFRDNPTFERFAILTPTSFNDTVTAGQLTWWSIDGSAGSTSDEVFLNTVTETPNLQGFAVRNIFPTGETPNYTWVVNEYDDDGFRFVDWGSPTIGGTTGLERCNFCPVYDSTNDKEWIIVGNAINASQSQASLVDRQAGDPAIRVNFGSFEGIYSAAEYLGQGLYISQIRANSAGDYRWMIYHMANEDVSSDDFRGGPFDIYDEFGWDGANWVLGNPNSKVTHVGDETLIDGLQIRFEEDAGSPADPGNFIVTDFYDVYVADGIFKDDATRFDYELKAHVWGSIEGDTFVPATVPGVAAGAVVGEPLHMNSKSSASRFSEPGWTGSTTTARVADQFGDFSQQVLTGDFSIRFNLYPHFRTGGAFSQESFFGIVRDADKATWLSDSQLNSVVSGLPYIGMMLELDGTDNTAGVVDLWVVDNGVVTNISTITDFDPNDDWEISRTAGAITLLRNSVTVHTYGANSDDMVVAHRWELNHPMEVDNVVLDYTDTSLYVEVDGLVNDNNFRDLSTYEYDDGVRQIFLDGTPAVIITDPTATPAAGEVVIGRSGRLLFNVADAGRTVTGTYRYHLKNKLVSNP
jgi:hypothetical protein